MKLLPVGFNAIEKPLYMTDDRKSHHHVIGSSGSGKSKFLEQMMRADIQAGKGFCLIDPHGTLYNDVLRYCAYHVVKRDIIILNLSEPEHIIGFNFFTKNKTGKTNVQVDNLIQATLHAWNAKNSENTPTLGRMLKVIYTSILDAELTLPQVAQLIDFNSAKIIKEDLAEKIQNDLIRREWLELASLTKLKDFRDEILSLKNRLFPFLTSETLMQFIGLKGRTIDLLDAIDKQKIILVNLAQSDDLSYEEARLFGSLLVNQFFQIAKKRKKDISGRDPNPYYLYLDEFQNFVSLDLCNMLDEIRKFGLFLTMSHQRFGQIDEDLIDATLTNCKTKTVFGGLRVNSAKIMAEEMFIGKIDPMKVKVAIYQTKHLYKYVREKVYSKSKSYGESDGESIGEGIATGSTRTNSQSSGGGGSTGNTYQLRNPNSQTLMPPTAGNFYTGEMWLSEGASFSEAESSSVSESESRSKFSSRSRSTNWNESESVADIPVFVPVPIQELSSIQYYTPEEQLFELTKALKLQQQRHCFIQLPDQETQPLLVPLVDKFFLSTKNLNWYIEKITQKYNSITPDEANRLISEDINLGIFRKNSAPTKAISNEDNPKLLQKTKTKKIFDRIKEANPDINI